MIDAKVDLIRRIRQKLNINPTSKSTLVKKSQLLQYAKQLQEQNLAMRQILNPSLGAQLSDIQRQREQKNIKLVLYESALRDEKYKEAILENSIKYYQDYIQQSKKTLLQHKQRIAELKRTISGDRQTLKQLDSFRNVITEKLEDKVQNEGEVAMLNLMKQFLEVNQSLSSDSEVVQYR